MLFRSPKTVSLAATKVYDGNTSLSADQVTVTTGVGSETLNATGTANNANVAITDKYFTAATLANGTGSSAGLASNYQLPTLDNTTAAVTITPKTVSLAATKVYDGNTSLSADQVTVTTGVGSETLNATDRKSTRLNSCHSQQSRMPSSA